MEYGFLLKKVIAAFCMPLPLAVLLLLLALFLIGRGHRTTGRGLMVLNLAFVYIVSIHPTGEWLARKLEQKYPAYSQSQNEHSQNIQAQSNKVDYVLVLGSYHFSDDTQPITSLLSSVGLTRLMEGLRIYRLNPGSKLLFSGYRGRDQLSHAQALKNVALSMGVPEQDILLAEQVKDTREETLHWIGVVKNDALAVVSSAIHMPRIMYLFEQAAKQTGYQPTLFPGPTEFISHEQSPSTWNDWFPSGRNLYRVERAWHEYLGLIWAKINA